MFVKTIRWILILPAAILAAFISPVVIHLVSVLNQWLYSDYLWFSGPLFKVISAWILEMVKSLLFGAIFVIVGSTVAPLKRIWIANLLAIIITIFSAFTLIPGIASSSSLSIIGSILMAFGGIGAAFSINKEMREVSGFQENAELSEEES